MAKFNGEKVPKVVNFYSGVLTKGNEYNRRAYLGEWRGSGERDNAEIRKRGLGENKNVTSTLLSYVPNFGTTLGPYHEHIFFEDEKGGNIGFTTSGISDVIDSHFSEMTGLFYEETKTFGKFFTETNPNIIARYRETDGKHYDDVIMRKAVEDVKKSGNFNYYNLLMNNCQDFVKSVKIRYSEIAKEQRERK